MSKKPEDKKVEGDKKPSSPEEIEAKKAEMDANFKALEKDLDIEDVAEKSLEEEVHATFLSDKEKEKIRLEVIKEIEIETKQKVAADYKAKLMSDAKRKALLKDALPGQDADGLVPVFVDLPKVSEAIRLDGISYYHGHTYNVTPQVRDVINEAMFRGRAHEDEINGRTNSNEYRKPTNLTAI